MKIKMHSFVDVITNSSTEIFTSVTDNGVENLYEIINAVMKICNISGEAKDFFEIRTVPEDYYKISELALDDEEFNKKYPEFKGLDYRDRFKFLEENNRWEEVSFDPDEDFVSMTISVKELKDGAEVEEISKNLSEIFYSE